MTSRRWPHIGKPALTLVKQDDIAAAIFWRETFPYSYKASLSAVMSQALALRPWLRRRRTAMSASAPAASCRAWPKGFARLLPASCRSPVIPRQASRTVDGMPRRLSDRATCWVGLLRGWLLCCLFVYMLAGVHGGWLHLRIGCRASQTFRAQYDADEPACHLRTAEDPEAEGDPKRWRRPLQLGPSVPPLVALTAEGGAEAQLSYEYGGTGGDTSGGAVPIYIAIGDVIKPPAPPYPLPSSPAHMQMPSNAYTCLAGSAQLRLSAVLSIHFSTSLCAVRRCYGNTYLHIALRWAAAWSASSLDPVKLPTMLSIEGRGGWGRTVGFSAPIPLLYRMHGVWSREHANPIYGTLQT